MLLLLLLVLWGEWCRCAFEDVGHITLDGDVRIYIVDKNLVYAATNQRLYRLNHDLTVNQSLSMRGIMEFSITDRREIEFIRTEKNWTTTLRTNLLIPFEEDNLLFCCGSVDRKTTQCEVLDRSNISILTYREAFQVGPIEFDRCPRNVAPLSVSFLVKVPRSDTGRTHTYILTAIGKHRSCPYYQEPNVRTINFHNTNESDYGYIFGTHDKLDKIFFVNRGGEVDFVDGFQVNTTIYLFSNVPNRVRLLWLDGRISKKHIGTSIRGAILVVNGSSGQTHKLVGSSLVPGGDQLLWGGVFSSGSFTELALFDITPNMTLSTNVDPDFCMEQRLLQGEHPQCSPFKPPMVLRPKAVLLRVNNMTSVLAVRNKAWTIFFIGTYYGQLIKFVVDKNFRCSCPVIVLFSGRGYHQAFHKILMDPVDHRHIYFPMENEIRRVPISRCRDYTDVRMCWSSQDPLCVWCGSKTSCIYEDECEDSDWVSIPEDPSQRMVSYSMARDVSTGQITLNIQTHMSAGQLAMSNFSCEFFAKTNEACNQGGPPSHFPRCTCMLREHIFPTQGLELIVRIRLGKTVFTEPLVLTKCSDIKGPKSVLLCQRCIRAGCVWSSNLQACTWANEGPTDEDVCQTMSRIMNVSISSITPSVVSVLGKNNVLLSGHNLNDVIGVRIHSTCYKQLEMPVFNNTGVSLMFHLPTVNVAGSFTTCVVLSDGSCQGNMEVNYIRPPFCNTIQPNITWRSGKRKVKISGKLLDFVEGIKQSNTEQEARIHATRSQEEIIYHTLPTANSIPTSTVTVFLRGGNSTVPCVQRLSCLPDPTFSHFKLAHWGTTAQITLEKTHDHLSMTTEEISIWGVHNNELFPCIVVDRRQSSHSDLFICEIAETNDTEIRQLLVTYGDVSVTLYLDSPLYYLWLLLIVVLVIFFFVAVLLIYRRKQKILTKKMNRFMENLELDIRNDIRQGFVDLQTETDELMENIGTVPFLDYKHYACKIFFPENEALVTLCIKDESQDSAKVQLDECCHGLSQLIHNQCFLKSMVHALEEQKTFTIKDKCLVASLLTVTLHNDLVYLTEMMEVLLKDLMLKNNNSESKLLLRRTESIVEKLLTNWMSICLYSLLRESVGQHLFLLVSALTQHINKGPVDCVTQKALYTLSEDWLLWQAQDFSTLKLKVLFAMGSDDEVSEPLDVSCLTCDTVEQVKEKVLSTFKAKFGFPFKMDLRDIHIKYEKDGIFIPLEEVDGSSVVMADMMMLNTMKHYQVPDGATLKVLSNDIRPPLSPQGSVKDDENFTGKYFHLIDPDVVEDPQQNSERKKLKVKEVHLTKLISTKVAVHLYVENLFRSIWGLPLGKAPEAIKYFFDFLDNLGKISDPDVLHIWKTNSLPLRYWVNILKNPQFVFDLEKSPQLDACLTVIAQAFMDSFSLNETQLDKNTPTNKLLYAKDIPKFKQEVKEYYKQIQCQPSISRTEFQGFLLEESKKLQDEFNESAALREIYKFIRKYFTQIQEKLTQSGAPTELTEQLNHVRDQFEKLNSCSWDSAEGETLELCPGTETQKPSKESGNTDAAAHVELIEPNTELEDASVLESLVTDTETVSNDLSIDCRRL